jgi:Dehydrogenases with different specificities (related to short-chain alcohol dehydrogenases)
MNGFIFHLSYVIIIVKDKYLLNMGEYKMYFNNKLICVSGASSGIGKSCANMLLQAGAIVAGFDINENTINHKNYSHYTLDVRDEQKIMLMVDNIEEKFGKIDGLVNSAGIYASTKPFYEISSDEWNNIISINLTGVFTLSKNIARKMMKYNDGKIVNISCIRSKIFRPNMADYAASKGGVVALTSAMALDLKDYNIRVNSVAPGFTYTEMTSKSFNDPEIKKFSESIIPVGRIANPEDIANVVLFLLSDMADYISGETIYVDGGFKTEK